MSYIAANTVLISPPSYSTASIKQNKFINIRNVYFISAYLFYVYSVCVHFPYIRILYLFHQQTKKRWLALFFRRTKLGIVWQ